MKEDGQSDDEITSLNKKRSREEKEAEDRVSMWNVGVHSVARKRTVLL